MDGGGRTKEKYKFPGVGFAISTHICASQCFGIGEKLGGGIPKKFEKLSAEMYRVTCDGMMMAQKILQHNGRKVYPFDFIFKVEKLPYEMSFEEMLIYFEGKLVTREMIGETQNFNGKGRRLRETSAVEKKPAQNSSKENFSGTKNKKRNFPKKQKKFVERNTEKHYHHRSISGSESGSETLSKKEGGGKREEVPRESRPPISRNMQGKNGGKNQDFSWNWNQNGKGENWQQRGNFKRN